MAVLITVKEWDIVIHWVSKYICKLPFYGKMAIKTKIQILRIWNAY